MPLALQAKLLRALQDGEVEPVGSNQLARVDVRVIAATSRPLADMVRAGTFRQDLYYRLNVLSIRLPPLRERAGDIELLAGKFSERIAQSFAVAFRPLSRGALDLLEAHTWPGNVRELANVIEQAYVRSESDRIDAADIAAALGIEAEPSAAQTPPSTRLSDAVEDLERRMITDALRRCGNRQAAARALGISRSNLYAKMQRHGLGESGTG